MLTVGIVGFLIGAFLGILFMCLLAVGKDDED